MKILMLTPYLPYPDSSGGQIRTQNLLKHLCKNHEITLVSLIKDAKENENIMHLLKYCKKVMTFQRSATPWTLKNILKTGFSFDPFLIVRNFAPGVKEAVTKAGNGGVRSRSRRNILCHAQYSQNRPSYYSGRPNH